MNPYLLSVFEVECQVTGAPSTTSGDAGFMGRVIALEEMDRAGASAFGRALDGSVGATVIDCR